MNLSFSVIIPTRHRASTLSLCLERLAPGAQRGVERAPTGARTYEVIVSDAGTAESAEALLGGRFPWVRWSAAPNHGPGPNRNEGAKLARGDWIAFVDDDCLPNADWLEQLAAIATTDRFDVIEGAVLSPDLPDHPLWVAPVNTAGNAGWTANLCVRRVTFEKLGGFDPDLPETAEDMEFHQRSKRLGARWVFAVNAAVVHPPRKLSWPQFWRETLRFRWWFMYRLKIGWGPGPGAGAWRTLADVISSLWILYARNTWHLIRDVSRGQRHSWRRTLFLCVRDWLLFPFLVPYFWKWASAYRQQLRERGT